MTDTIEELVDRLAKHRILDREEFCFLIDHMSGDGTTYLYEETRNEALDNYGNRIFVRGLMEFANYYKNDCYYYGMRRSDPKAARYRLAPGQVMNCCRVGHGLGLCTSVFRGREDPQFTDERIACLAESIKKSYPDCTITLSVSEKDLHIYKRWFDAGAGRCLLRHETINLCYYASLHPLQMSSERHKECLRNLKAIGYQTGCGIVVGVPYQTAKHIAKDLELMCGLQPEMVRIGPFIPHHDAPFKDRPTGTLRQILLLLAIVRLMLSSVPLPATMALGTIEENGWEQGAMTGTDTVMPDLSPVDVRKKYMLYDNKTNIGVEAATDIGGLERRMRAIGYEMVTDRGDYKKP